MSAADGIRRAMADPLLAGVQINWVPGWETRGRTYATLVPRGFVGHHSGTSSAARGDYPSLAVVRDGRSDLPGPLSQFGLGRSGAIYVIAGGTSNHAGPGGWKGLVGNGSVLGCEAENDGIGEPWSARQVYVYIRLMAACARAFGFGSEMVCRHAEWSSQGKTDTATPPLNNGSWIRSRVAELMSYPTTVPGPAPTPTPAPKPTQPVLNQTRKVKNMLIFWKAGKASLLLANGKVVWVTSIQDLEALRAAGVPEAKGDLSDAQIAEFAK